MQTKNDKPVSTLEKAKQQLDAVIGKLKEPSALRRWRVWHGPAGSLSAVEATKGDTSDWTQVNTPYRLSRSWRDTWFRYTIVYPDRVEGIPVEGSAAELAAALPLRSRIYVDGRLAAEDDWWLDVRIAPLPLTEAVRPGQAVDIACYIPQGDGLDGFGGVQVHYRRVEETIFALELLRAQVLFSHLLAKKSGDSSRLVAWQEAVESLPWADLEGRRWEAWRAGVVPVVERLAALSPEAKRYVVHVAAHAHIDMNWLWPWEDTVDVIRRDFQAMDKLMERYRQFHFSQSQASTYWAMEKYEPEILARVASRVRERLWEVTANTWVENDLNMSSGEAIAHHFLYTRRYMNKLFGITSRLVWEPDTFGHPATMPQIARKAGAEYYYFCRGGKRYPLFWWESPDGSRVLGFQDLHWYLGDLTPRVVADSAMELAEQYDLRHSLVVYGAGDHGGGATARDLEAARVIDQAPSLPTVLPSSVTAFFSIVQKANPDLPVVRGELNPVFAGCYTSHADIKRLNRTGERTLLDAETVAAVASLTAGHPYPRTELEESWRAVLFQQFHDILCGCGIGLTSKTAHEWAEPAIEKAREITNSALDAIIAKLDLGPGKRPHLVVFNTLPWPRIDVVKAPVDWECAWVVDDHNDRWPAQRSGKELVFLAENVPAFGCRIYRPGDMTPLPDDRHGVRSPADLTLENEYVRFTVNPNSGAIDSFFDMEAKRDLTLHAHGDPGAELETTGVLNRMQIWWEQPHGMSAWKLGDISRVDHLVSGAKVRLVECGPVRGAIEVRRQFLKSHLVQRIVLYRRSRRIDFETEVEWHEKGSDQVDAPMLRVQFSPFLGATEATFQIPFGTIQRPADGQEVPAQMWADLSEVADQNGYGVALLNDCKYGYQAHGNTLGLTLIRASYEPDLNPDEGRHMFTYALYPHSGSWREAAVERRAQELNRPLLSRLVVQGRDLAKIPKIWSAVPGLRCTPDNVAVTAFKLAEEDEAVIVRLVEMHGQATEAKLRLILPILKAKEVTLAEEPLAGRAKGLTVAEGGLQVALRPYEIRTIRLLVDREPGW